MAGNIEIKARANNFARQHELAAALSHTPCQLLSQEDTFFHVPQGRLKLRILSPTQGELIYYERQNTAAPKPSHYEIIPTQAPIALKKTLARALGVRGVVRKQRWLYMVGQTRVHLDDVEGLGTFIELEWVMQSGQTVAEGTQALTDLMQQLDIDNTDLIEDAYIDLLTVHH